MLHLLDLFFTLLHFVIIGFNLLAWLVPKLLKAHLLFVLITLGCWFGLGIWYGIGYCPITDWHWEIKEQLGERDLPNSFIKYYADKLFNIDSDPVLIDWLTGLGFAAAILISCILNYKAYKRQSQIK